MLGSPPQGSAGWVKPDLCAEDSAQAPDPWYASTWQWLLLSNLIAVAAVAVQVAVVHLAVVNLVPAQFLTQLPLQPLPCLWVCLSPCSCIRKLVQQGNGTTTPEIEILPRE